MILQLVLDQLNHFGQHRSIVQLQRATGLPEEHLQDVLLRVRVLDSHLTVIEGLLEQIQGHQCHRTIGMGQGQLQTGIIRCQVDGLRIELNSPPQLWRFSLVQLIAELTEEFTLLCTPVTQSRILGFRQLQRVQPAGQELPEMKYSGKC